MGYESKEHLIVQIDNQALSDQLKTYTTKVSYSHIVFGGAWTIKVQGAANNVVTISNLTLYAIGKDGQNKKALTTPINNTFTMQDNQVLLWNWDTNTIEIKGNNDARPTEFVVLLYLKSSYFCDGEMATVVNQAINKTTYLIDSVPQTSESRSSVAGIEIYQDVTVVKDKIWCPLASNADHSNMVGIRLYDKDTLTALGWMTHSFGHAASVDYNVKYDCVIMGNGESDIAVLPRIDIILNASSYNVGAALDFNTTPKISIDFFKKDVSGTVLKEIGGSGCVACFGEEPWIVYMITGQGSVKHRIFKVLLGTGTNDFSDSTGTDLAKWGTFVAGKGVDEFNGTAKILQTFEGIEYNTSQGLCFHDGKLFYAITSSPNTCEVIEVQLHENNTFKALKTYKYPSILQNGATPNYETEGVAILNGMYLIAGYYAGGNYSVLFPLYNEMGGKATAGVHVTLPFKCNSTPQIMITPTSNVVDLYVSSVDAAGFTVSSVSGQSGTYNWKCKIS